jgi:choline dehydrogenase
VKAFDVVIVGGGSAGCALASRLTADGSRSVLVLEAGRSDYPWDLLIQMPAALTFPSGNPLYDWRYESEPEPFMNGRRIARSEERL